MVLLNNDAFLAELAHMFQKSRSSRGVTVTMKKYDGRKAPVTRKGEPPVPTPKEYHCLMRAVFKTKRISTIIAGKNVEKFQQAYISLLRGNLDGLKKLKKPKGKPKAT